MRIDIIGNGVEVTDALRQFTESKLGRLQKHFEHIMSINVIFKIENLQQIAEATVSLSQKGDPLHAKSNSGDSGDMYSAVDALVDKLDRQIKKHKEKLQSH